jgi:hypothetical protein
MCHRNENCLILASLWIHSGFPKGVPVAYIFSIRRRVVVLHVFIRRGVVDTTLCDKVCQ